MTLNLDRSTWARVEFGDVVSNINVNVKDPAAAGIDRVLGLEHLDPGELAIRRWGDTAEETTFTRRVRPGQTLFGKRRAYQRKTAYAEFDAICSGDILVFAPKNPDVLLPELLPFICTTDAFYAKALETSAGSLSPRTRWSDLSKYEFQLPPLKEQRRIAGLLWAVEHHSRGLIALAREVDVLASLGAAAKLRDLEVQYPKKPLLEVISAEQPLCYGVVQPGVPVDDGVRLIRVCDMEGDTVDIAQLRTISRDIDVQYRRSRLREGDVLVSVVGTIGRVHVATEEMTGYNIARAIARIAPDTNQVSSEYLAHLLRTHGYQAILEKEAFESARKTLNLGALGAIKVPVPPLSVQREVLDADGYSAEARRAVTDELGAVTMMRASLLHQVFGEV